jgi:hypothetical protein
MEGTNKMSAIAIVITVAIVVATSFVAFMAGLYTGLSIAKRRHRGDMDEN